MSGASATGAVVSGQRRLLTVVFCDLVGSTALSYRLDPETYAEVMLAYQETARRIVESYGGVVAQFAGDDLVIQFGYPVAHENDAERAVEAALGLQRAIGAIELPDSGVAFQCRIGIHSALTVVSRMNSDGRTDMTLFGTTANVASRVQSAAEPGQVYVTDAVIELLRGEYQLADYRLAELRGLDAPIGVARIVSRSEGRPIAEMVDLTVHAEPHARLAARWADASSGRGGAVVIVGPPGIGKSTLVDAVRCGVPSANVIEARARELTVLVPFSTLSELAHRCLADPALAGAASGLLAALGDGGGSAEQGWRIVIEQSRILGDALATQGRLIIVEDIHWLDASSRAALEVITAAQSDSSSLVVATSRPPVVLAGAESIEVGPVDDAEARRLIVAVVAQAARAAQAQATGGGADPELGLPAHVVDEIVARSGGVPLYLIALTQAAVSGRGTELPDSLQSSLLARLDRFPELRRLAQVASVLGDRVDPNELAAAVEAAEVAEVADSDGPGGRGGAEHPPTTAMVDAGLLAVAGDSTIFSHALLREAIYSSLLQRDRRRLHVIAAAVISDRGGRDDERVTTIAHHLERAGDPIGAANHLAIAARRSARRGAWAESVSLSERGLGLLNGQTDRPDIALHLTMTLGNSRFAVESYGAPGLLDLWQRAEALAARCGDRTEQSSAMNGQAAAALFSGQYETSAAGAERLLDFGRMHGDRPAMVRGHCSLALARLYAGAITSALTHARAMIAMYEPGDDELLTYGFGTDHGVIGLTAAAIAAWFADEIDADELAAAAIAHGEQIESPISLCLALQQSTIVDLLSERFGAVIATADRLIAVAERFALTFFTGLARLARAAAAAQLGDGSAAASANAALAELTGTSELALTLGVWQLALSAQGVGDLATASATAAFGLAIARERNEWIFEVELAEIVARCTPSAEAWDALSAAADRATARGAHRSAARARRVLATRT